MEQIDAKSFASRWKPGTLGIVLLDVREHEELEIAAVPGATHIPMGEITTRLADLDRKSEIVVMCHHGMRSLRVANYLASQGFEKVKNLAGGIDAWSDHVDRSIPKY